MAKKMEICHSWIWHWRSNYIDIRYNIFLLFIFVISKIKNCFSIDSDPEEIVNQLCKSRVLQD